eukprot:sb/3468835/
MLTVFLELKFRSSPVPKRNGTLVELNIIATKLKLFDDTIAENGGHADNVPIMIIRELTVNGNQGWEPVQKGVKTDYDLDTRGLEVQATAKSVVFIDINIGYIGFGYDESSYHYKIKYCEPEWVKFDKQPPSTTDGIDTWKLIKTKEAFIIWCNEMELLELRFADAGCAMSWADVAVTDFTFHDEFDQGSILYRPVYCPEKENIKGELVSRAERGEKMTVKCLTRKRSVAIATCSEWITEWVTGKCSG